MEKKYLIGIDAGTTAIKAVLFDLRGRQIDCAEAENEEMGTASVNAMHFNSAVAG